MAEGLWNQLGQGEWRAVSAGSKPAGFVHPLAIAAMHELQIDIGQNVSKHMNEYQDWVIDLVVTVCDNARETCVVYSKAKMSLHWPFEDPAHAEGTEVEKMIVFRRIRNQIRDRIHSYLDTKQLLVV
jgi:arsenate reductase (thioredoxin)